MTQPFRASRHHYENNNRNALAANVRTAVIEAPHGREETGIALSIGSRPALILNPDQAFRIATDIADILTEFRRQK